MPDNPTTACFIDTNIWLYAFIESGETTKSAQARRLIQENEPIVSTQVINEVCVNLLRCANFTEEHHPTDRVVLRNVSSDRVDQVRLTDGVSIASAVCAFFLG